MKLNEFKEILDHGYPTSEQLTAFPLGNILQKLDMLAWTKNSRTIILQGDEPNMNKEELQDKLKNDKRMLGDEILGEVYRQHIKKVMECIVWLTDLKLEYILPNFHAIDWSKSPIHEYNSEFLESINKNDELKTFLRFVSLYHDIGKVIHRDRHPVLGRHLLESITDDAVRDLKDLLGENLFLMTELVTHHDLFGVLCTGEASRPVLIDALRLENSDLSIGLLVTMNLADIYGTLPKMTPEIFNTVLSDWLFMRRLIQNQEPEQGIIYRSLIEKQVLSRAQEQERTIERLRRLFNTIFNMLSIIGESKSLLTSKITSDIIYDALKTRLGPELIVFCYDFALVCKLDYLLKFFVDLVSQWYESQLKKNSIESIDIRSIVSIIIEILVRLVSNYRDLTRQKDGWSRRIGLELLGVTRSEGISKRIIELLLSDRRIEGVNWIADEATAWYFI